MRTVSSDKRSSRAARKRVVAALACALGIASVGATAADAQTGGAGAPGATTPPTTTTAPTTRSHVFPIPGYHYYGQGFGAGRGHRGQDVFAACGEPLVAVTKGRVVFTGKHGRAGNYFVMRNKKLKQDYGYMHLMGKPLVRKKQKVRKGQLVGYVGQSGNASGCHLHFELWTGRWYRGGRASKAVTYWLQQWDAYS